MCRMLGIASNNKISPLWFEDFQRLSVTGNIKESMNEGHGDGWGIAGYLGKWTVHFGRSAGSAGIESAVYETATNKALSSGSKIIIAHLRKASEGCINLENSHPFIHGEWIFCHNGTIDGSNKLILPRYNYEGDTDSERFFKFLVSRLEIGRIEDYPDIIKIALKELKETCKYTSLTFLLTNGRCLIGYRDFNEEGDYYTLFYSNSGPRSFSFCSEQLPGLDWTEMANGQLVIADKEGCVLYGI